MGKVSTGVAAVLAPLLVTVVAKTIVPLGATVAGAAVCAKERLALSTVTVLVSVVVPVRVVVEVTVAEPLITVCPAVPAFTFTVITMLAVPLAGKFAESVQVTVPVPPTATPAQLQPAGAVAETNVVFVGVACVMTGL